MSLDRTLPDWTPTDARNAVLPTCCVAGLANSLRLWGLMHGFDIAVAEQKLFDLYAAVAGCAPTPEAIAGTQGLVMLDLLQHVRRHGFDFGGQAPAELTFAAIGPQDTAALRDAIYVRGSVFAGVTLYAGDLVLPPNRIGAPVGALDGGHCIVPFRYSATGWTDADWGQPIEDSLEWMAARLDEAYAIQWLLPVAG
jgi:hypothetical protein